MRSRWGASSDRLRRHATALAACAGAALALVILVPQPASASAVPQTASLFSINGQATFTRTTRVEVGDQGWSPFFSPAVLVWDGGSIIGGFSASPDLDYASQTTRLLPHPCQEYVSASGGARLAQMLAEAPTEVDARYRADADTDICLVMAGAGDIVKGNAVDAIFADVERYCLGRRAAGFRVVVVTLLPRSRPDHFESDRLALNALVRDEWPSFADGVADVAADSRIGDTSDNLDRKYYQSDGVHPTDAGYAVMAAATAPVLNALQWHSDDCEMRFSNDGAAWSDWRGYAAGMTWWLEPGDGTKTVYAEYRDGAGPTVALSDTIGLDTVPPRTYALRSVTVRRGRTAALPYIVRDAQPCGPTADVTVAVRTPSGKLVKKLLRPGRTIGVAHSAAFRCWLAKGTYRFFVYARDTAGNKQSRVGTALLTVR